MTNTHGWPAPLSVGKRTIWAGFVGEVKRIRQAISAGFAPTSGYPCPRGCGTEPPRIDSHPGCCLASTVREAVSALAEGESDQARNRSARSTSSLADALGGVRRSGRVDLMNQDRDMAEAGCDSLRGRR